ncbi:hypothetical protein EV356DRAFT_513134 [Viridothelium virens]|uniref:Uncharacterized protein n=1 Tax=Viridothelium virens TaxID=1048519 RepID=A0A6A6HDK5_VIRVR|nr:hypothetical protein EV356DRAFT_513134 [Viridothelium virens]
MLLSKLNAYSVSRRSMVIPIASDRYGTSSPCAHMRYLDDEDFEDDLTHCPICRALLQRAPSQSKMSLEETEELARDPVHEGSAEFISQGNAEGPLESHFRQSIWTENFSDVHVGSSSLDAEYLTGSSRMSDHARVKRRSKSLHSSRPFGSYFRHGLSRVVQGARRFGHSPKKPCRAFSEDDFSGEQKPLSLSQLSCPESEGNSMISSNKESPRPKLRRSDATVVRSDVVKDPSCDTATRGKARDSHESEIGLALATDQKLNSPLTIDLGEPLSDLLASPRDGKHVSNASVMNLKLNIVVYWDLVTQNGNENRKPLKSMSAIATLFVNS